MMADELKATALFETLLLLQIKRLALSEGYCDASRFILVNLAEQIIQLEVLNRDLILHERLFQLLFC